MHFKVPYSKWVWESYRKVETLDHLRQGWAGLEIYPLYNNNFLEQFEMFGRKRRFFDANMREICFPTNRALIILIMEIKVLRNFIAKYSDFCWNAELIVPPRGERVNIVSVNLRYSSSQHRNSRREITLVGRTLQNLLLIDILNAYINITHLHSYGYIQ